MNKKAVVIGWINTGKPADCGETMKNQLMISKLSELGVSCTELDFKNWKKHPWVLLRLAYHLFLNQKATIILSTSAKNVYPMMKLMKLFHLKQNTVHWVIGGSLGNSVLEGKYDRDVMGYIKHTIVESPVMKEQLDSCGIPNVRVLPNFKPIPYYPPIQKKYPESGAPLRLVFMSRIMPEKGCDYILDAAAQLNAEGLGDRFIIDFYGKIAEEYRNVFTEKIGSLPNVQYQGFLNLRENAGYDTLSSYDLMLFPTYWKGEGFAGVFIDSFIAGVPMLASDWAHNKVFLKDGENAMLVPVHDMAALKEQIKACIDGACDLQKMAENCQKTAAVYDVDNVVTEDLLSEIGIL